MQRQQIGFVACTHIAHAVAEHEAERHAAAVTAELVRQRTCAFLATVSAACELKPGSRQQRARADRSAEES